MDQKVDKYLLSFYEQNMMPMYTKEIEEFLKKYNIEDPQVATSFLIKMVSIIFKKDYKELIKNCANSESGNVTKNYEFSKSAKPIAEKLWDEDIKATNLAKEIRNIKDKYGDDKEKINLYYALIGYDGFGDEKNYYKNAKNENFLLKTLRDHYQKNLYNSPAENVAIIKNTYRLALKKFGGSKVREVLKNEKISEKNIIDNIDLKSLSGLIQPIERRIVKNAPPQSKTENVKKNVSKRPTKKRRHDSESENENNDEASDEEKMEQDISKNLELSESEGPVSDDESEDK